MVVSAACRNCPVVFRQTEIGVKFQFTVNNFYLLCICSEEETCSVKCIFIKKGEYFLHFSFKHGVYIPVCNCGDLKVHMEAGSCGFCTFRQIMMPAISNCKSNIGKCRFDIIYRNPVRRIVRMVIIAVHAKAVRPDEVILAAIVILVFCHNMVKANSGRKALCISHFDFVWIKAVLCITAAFCCEKGKFHFRSSNFSVKYRILRCFRLARSISDCIPAEMLSPNTHSSAHLLINTQFMKIAVSRSSGMVSSINCVK